MFLGAVFGFLSFAGFEAAATLGEETRDPTAQHPARDPRHGDLRRRLLHRRHGGRDDGASARTRGRAAYRSRRRCSATSAAAYVGSWVGDMITLGAAISAFGCCLACMVGGSRLLYALGRDAVGARGIGRTSGSGTPVAAVTIGRRRWRRRSSSSCALFSARRPADTFIWSGTIGTLILLVAYLLTTIGAIRLIFVQRRMRGAAVAGRHPAGRARRARLHASTATSSRTRPRDRRGGSRWWPGGRAGAGAVIFAVLAAPAALAR